MKMRKLLALILALSMAATVAACGSASSAAKPAATEAAEEAAEPAEEGGEEAAAPAAAGGDYTIRVALENSETYPATLGLQQMKKYVESHTDGHVKIDIYANGQLGGEEDTLDQVAQGTLEMAVASFAPVVSFDNEFELLDIPFVFGTYEEAWMVLDSYVGTQIMDSLESAGMKGLAFMENGFRQATSSKGAIETMADLSGLKIRTMQNNNHMEAFSAMGANPTPVPFSELYMALQQKVADAQENPIANVTDKKLYEVQQYLSLTNQIYDAMPLVCNLDFFNSLPAEYQSVVQAGAIYGMEYSRFCNHEREDLILEYLEGQGMKINEVTPEAREEMKAAAQPAVVKLVSGDIGQEKVDEYLANVEAILGEIANY